jgi:hypothetical protein
MFSSTGLPPQSFNGDNVNLEGIDYPASTWGAAGVGLTNYMGVAGLFATVNGTLGNLQIQNYKGAMLYVAKAQNNDPALRAE